MRKQLVFACALCVLTASDATLAQATPPPSKTAVEIDRIAAQHYELASRFYGEGQYEAARVEFEASYELTNHADLLHNLSLVAEKQERWADAIRLEEQFLDAPTLILAQRERDEARGRIARLREKANEGSSPSLAKSPTVKPAQTQRRTVPSGALALMISGGGVLAAGLSCGAATLATRSELYDPMGIFADRREELVQRGQALDRAGIALDVIGASALLSGAIWAGVARRRETAR